MLTTFAGLKNPNGMWTLRFGDEVNSLTAAVESASLTITAKDTIPPNTTFTKKPPLRTSSRQATFKFKSSEVGSTFLCKLDSQAFRRCSSPKTVSVGLGRHTFQVKARDKAGNVETTPAKHSWRVVRAG